MHDGGGAAVGALAELGRHVLAAGHRFASEGFGSIVINFSHNGVGADARRFNEPEKFARNKA